MEAATNSNGKAAPPRARMALGAVTKGKIAKPQRVVIFGTDGLGKSTFAADAPAPIFICSEAGTEHLDVARFPTPRAWTDVLDACDALMGEHAYKTVAIDTLDWLEPMCWAHTCATKKNGDKRAEHIEDFGFGKGFTYALDTWRVLLGKLDRLRDERGMNVILIAHSHIPTFKSPDTEDYQRYEIAVNGKAAAMIRQWADVVLFAAHEIATHKQNNRAKGVGTGARLIYTERTAAYDAKNRAGLPESLPLSWPAFETALSGVTPATWRERITGLLVGTTEEIQTRVTKAVAAAGDDSAKLATIANYLQATKEGVK
jgi:hypothetical protein